MSDELKKMMDYGEAVRAFREREKQEAQSELAPAQCSAARELARELAKLISDAEDKTPYPSLAPDELENVIEKFLEARGLVQQNAELRHGGEYERNVV